MFWWKNRPMTMKNYPKSRPTNFFVKFNANSLFNGVYSAFYANIKWHWTYTLSIKH
jgi:hypothetical protein